MNKTFKNFLSLFIAIILIFSSLTVVANAATTKYTSGYYTYTVANGKAEITDFDDTVGGSITIPSTLGGYTVTSIGGFAFYLCDSLTSITIPNGVKSLGNLAFYGCSSLSKITIPNSVTSVGSAAFSGCSSLTSITIPSSITSISSEMFYRCTSLTRITIPTGVTAIESHAFAYCYSLVSVTIPNTVNSIGESAFSDCTALSNLTIPNGVETIGANAFYKCNKLSNVTLPESLLNIGENAFSWCSSLRSITIPDSVLSLGDGAFLDCDSLTDITIPENITSIGGSTFSNCDKLKSIVIPKSVSSIGSHAFFSCGSLADVYYMGTEKEWGYITINDYNDDLLNATIHFNYDPSHSHSYTSKITKSATCSQTGVRTYTCNCGDTYTETIPVTGNHSAGSWQIVLNPTTEQEGKKIKKCTSCGATVAEERIPKINSSTNNKDLVKAPSKTTISYGDAIILHANTENIPAGATIEWTASNNNFSMNVSSDGKTCKITPKSSGTTTFTVTVTDSMGNVISTDTQGMTSKAGFFDKIIAFFKGIFGLSKTYSASVTII